MPTEEFSAIHHALGRIEGAQESIITRLDKINGSVAKNNAWRLKLTGAVALLSALVAPIIVSYISKIIAVI